MKLKPIAGALVALFATSAQAEVIVTGILDGTFAGGDPKVIELYVSGEEDLSAYKIQRSANSGDFTTDIALSGNYNNQFVYLVNSSDIDDFETIFGTSGDYANIIANGSFSGNGNDAFRVVRIVDDAVIDQVDFAMDSQNTYRDSFLYRLDNTGPDGDFVTSNWSAFNNDALVGATAEEIRAAVPFGSFITDSTPTDPTDPTDPIDPPAEEITPIHDIQGEGSTSTLEGSEVVTTGVVVGDFQGVAGSTTLHPEQLLGFFIQTTDADADANPLTSQGLFVYCNNTCNETSVDVGDVVTVSGTVDERFGMTSIVNPVVSIDAQVEVLPTSTSIDLPVSSLDDYERYEGMLVTFTDTLSVAEYFQLSRFGEVVLYKGERPYQYTHDNAPDAEGLEAYNQSLALRRIILDDDANGSNQALFEDLNVFFPTPGLSTGNFFRGGDTISGLTGVLDYSFSNWRIRPVTQVYNYTFEPTNPRLVESTEVGGTLRIVNANVLNYFTTVDTGDSICGPAKNSDCRGADSALELERQTEKTVSALCAMDGDIVGVIEIENDADNFALNTLATELTRACGKEYSAVNTAPIGTDAIKVGLLYQDTVLPIGETYIIDDSVDPTYKDSRNRPTLVQEFQEVSSGESVIVAVHHLKSKGSSCSSIGDDDVGDGQGNCNLTRAGAVNVITGFIATHVLPDAQTDKVLAIGDMNSYKMEDPITAFKEAGYVDLIEAFSGEGAYSYVFDGQRGYLDHALGLNMEDVVTGVTEWHVNADEVNLFDYNDDVLDPSEASFEEEPDNTNLYNADPYRYSDHDPVVIGLDLSAGISEPLRGDWDGDGDVDINDYRGLLRAIQRGETVDIAFDINEDGRITTSDARALTRLCTRTRCAAN
ncbi:ExeM/NucH family extracellular endonuclease [Alteromonas abrolhosensis]|uniref:ExeM/NucH family extracellular endonuclease n=1 Tax=Alteromonas abrolhosensis TaxID=1892904 RepID=UPI003518B685